MTLALIALAPLATLTVAFTIIAAPERDPLA